MTTTDKAAGKLDIGVVLRETGGVIRRNIVPFGLLAVLFAGLPQLVLTLTLGGTMTPGGGLDPAFWGRFWLIMLIQLSIGSIVQGAVIYGAIADLDGKQVSFGDSLQVGLRNVVPLIAVTLLFCVALGLGFMLLFVPGVMIAVAYSVAIPSLLVERTGVFGAFKRSGQLTKGNRWRIFGLAMIYLVIVWLLSLISIMLSGGFTRAAAGFNANNLFFAPLLSVVNVLIATGGISVLYVELRRLRDGVGPAQLAAVFD